MSSRTAAYLHLLNNLTAVHDPHPGRGTVDQLTHSCQTATRATHAGADDHMVTVALLHDCFRVLAPATHAATAAAALADRLTPGRAAVLGTHSTWQHDATHGTRDAARWHAGQPWYADAEQLAGWDAASFDPTYPTLPLHTFVPLLERVLDDQPRQGR